MSTVRLARVARASAVAFSATAGLFLLAMVLLTVADVGSRTLRDQSILGTVDISTLLMVAIAFLGLASAEVDGRHVAVGMLADRLSPRRRMALSAVRLLLLAGIGLLLTWGLADVLVSAIDRAETTNDILRLPTWPAKLVLLVSFVLFFVTTIAKECREILGLRADRSDDGTTEPAGVPEKPSAPPRERVR